MVVFFLQVTGPCSLKSGSVLTTCSSAHICVFMRLESASQFLLSFTLGAEKKCAFSYALIIFSCARVSWCICWTEQVNARWQTWFSDLLEESGFAAYRYPWQPQKKPEIQRNAQMYCHYQDASYLIRLGFFCLLILLFSVAYTCNLEIPCVIFPS